MNIPFFSRFADERFLTHRQRSTSIAGIATAAGALVVFEYRLLFRHIWSFDLLAVGLGFVVIKYSVFLWYRLTD